MQQQRLLQHMLQQALHFHSVVCNFQILKIYVHVCFLHAYGSAILLFFVFVKDFFFFVLFFYIKQHVFCIQLPCRYFRLKQLYSLGIPYLHPHHFHDLE